MVQFFFWKYDNLSINSFKKMKKKNFMNKKKFSTKNNRIFKKKKKND